MVASISVTLMLGEMLLLGSILVMIVDTLCTCNEDDCNTTDESVVKVELITPLGTNIALV